VVKALKDPEGATFDPVVTTGGSEVKETASSLFVTEKVSEGGKRKRDEDGEEDEEYDAGDSKRRKGSEGGEGSEDEYTEE
jgi:hypothetical protein